MSTAHTPGPLRASGYHVKDEMGHIYAATLLPLERMRHGITIGEATANARLYAAAPDLLAALTELTRRYVQLAGSGDCGFWDPEEEDEVKAARAAIRNATGGQS